MAAEARRLGAACVGAFLLAEAGLLNGRTGNGRPFSAGPCPARSAWVRDGNIYTSAGISAGIDLALAWVKEDCGAGLAHEAARELVMAVLATGLHW
jgi:transcriptional regulator GlxA family with amidase domain